MSELILYTSDDGHTRLHVRVETETIWLSQLEIAELFQTTKQNVSLHAKNIFEDNELASEATVKESLTVQSEGGRQVSRENMEKIARERYEIFDQQRRIAEAKAADATDLKEIEQLEQDLKHKGKKHRQVAARQISHFPKQPCWLTYWKTCSASWLLYELASPALEDLLVAV